MSNSNITTRFLQCLDLLVAEGKVRSKRHFALSLGYHPQGISEMVAGRRDVPLDLLEKAIHEFAINPGFLFTGIGKPICIPGEEDGLRLRNLSIVTDEKGEERIVHVPYQAQAGYGGQLDDPMYIRELPTYQLPDPQFRSGTYRSFEIAGTSMEPTFRPHDIVIAAFVEPRYWEQAIKSSQIFIVITEQEVVIKRISNQLKSNGYLLCCSDNPEFDSYTIAGDSIREVWKARVKLTSYLEVAPTAMQSSDISRQLQDQQRILERLQHHFAVSD